MKNGICLFLFTVSAFNSLTFAAENSLPAIEQTRPKICLVLSGGGARGAAHIGAIKILEEYKVPVDCIVGTSMGALVGAAYATGNSVPELYRWASVINTQTLITDQPPRAELSFRRKLDDYNIFIGPEFGFKDWQFRMGKGIVSGIKIEMMLRQISKIKGYRNFDQLPIQFRAVATDLVTGKSIIFERGELASVMRASMSLPGIITPAEIDGMMLVDGMLTSNLPVEVARAMGADVIIAVNVGTPLLKKEEITSFVGIVNQMVGILSQQNVDDSIATLTPQDILISPDLGTFTVADFDKLPEIASLGESAARQKSKELQALALSKKEYNKLRSKQRTIPSDDLSPVDEIKFNNLTHVNPDYLRSLMTTQPQQPLVQATLDRDISWIYGTGDFERVNYKILNQANGQRTLAIDAIEKSWGPDYIRFGLGLSSDFEGGAFFNLLASYRKTWLNSFGAEWRTDLQVGKTSSFISEFYQPLDTRQYFFIAPHVGAKRESTVVYNNRDRVASYDIFSGIAGVDIGSLFFRYGELRLGFINGIMHPKLDSGAEIYSPGNKKVTQGAFRAGIILDQMDNVHFPRVGWRLTGRIFNSNSAIGADTNYTKWETNGVAAYSLGDHTLNIGLRGGSKIGSPSIPPYDLFQWGGFLQQSGYRTGQFLGENLAFGRVMYYHRIIPGTLFDGAYIGASFEAGRVGKPLVATNPDGILKSLGLFFAIDTPIGPVYLGHGRAENNNNSFYFYLGRPFE